MFTGAESYGIGISPQDKMSSVGTGHMNPNQAFQNFLSGGFNDPKAVKDLGREEFTPEKQEVKKSTPILTRNGQIILVVLVLGIFAYSYYQKHKAQKAEALQGGESGEQPPQEDINQTQNTSNAPIQEPSIKETGEASIIKSTAPESLEAQSDITN